MANLVRLSSNKASYSLKHVHARCRQYTSRNSNVSKSSCCGVAAGIAVGQLPRNIGCACPASRRMLAEQHTLVHPSQSSAAYDVRCSTSDMAAYADRAGALAELLGSPMLLDTGLDDGIPAQVYASSSCCIGSGKAECAAVASETLNYEPAGGHKVELLKKQHTQLQLEELLQSRPGRYLVHLFKDAALKPFMDAGMQVAAFELVLSQHNTLPKPTYKTHFIRNKLGCQHQDVRVYEPWFETRAYKGLPGALRLVFDLNPDGQRWFEFWRLCSDDNGLYIGEEPVSSDLIAFDRLAAGSGGFYRQGSWIFHARRSHEPAQLGVSVVVDVVVTAGLVRGAHAPCNPTFNFFHKHSCLGY